MPGTPDGGSSATAAPKHNNTEMNLPQEKSTKRPDGSDYFFTFPPDERHLLGIVSDHALGHRYGRSKTTIRRAREHLKIPLVPKDQRYKHMDVLLNAEQDLFTALDTIMTLLGKPPSSIYDDLNQSADAIIKSMEERPDAD